MSSVKSDLVVISWWSNCLGLTCLHRLAKYTRHRNIYVVQVGKTKRQKAQFRKYLPASVKELLYPEEAAAEHSHLIEAVIYKLLAGHAGLWFIDHDTFVEAGFENWLSRMDEIFCRSNICLCYPHAIHGPAITSPAFWLSPGRLPPGLPSFAASPYRETMVARRPDLFRHGTDLVMPQKDTLVLVKEFLAEQNLACSFLLGTVVEGQLPPLIHYQHLGGLHALAGSVPSKYNTATGPAMPDEFFVWLKDCIQRLAFFYNACPQTWLAIEEPVLLQRLQEFRTEVMNGAKNN